MLIQRKWLDDKNANTELKEWFRTKPFNDLGFTELKFLDMLIKDDRLQLANWAIVRIMTRPQYLAYAIYAAEQVIDIYEKKYPNDKRPRKAIEAAKAVLENDTVGNRKLARTAADAAASAAYAAYAAYAASDAAASDASDAYAYAAYAASDAAYAASDAYAAASDAASDAYADAAASAASDAAYARQKMRIKIIKYGIKLLKKGN